MYADASYPLYVNTEHGTRIDWMNALQHIPEDTFGPVLVTLNPPLEPDPVRVVGRYQYDHPVLGPEVHIQQPLHLGMMLIQAPSIGYPCAERNAKNSRKAWDLLRRGLAQVRIPRGRLHFGHARGRCYPPASIL